MSRDLTGKFGKEHPAYRNGSGKGYNSKNVPKSIKLLGYACQQCGKTTGPIALHHIDGNQYNNDVSNWKRLCFKCHKLLHSPYYGMTPKEKEKTQKAKQKKYYYDHPEKHGGINYKEYPDYVNSKEAAKILGLSRQRIHQIKDALRSITPKTALRLYEKESLFNYRKKSNYR